MHLEAQGISHRYGDLTVLDGIDLTIGEGEIVALIGPSGCGKSTLLNILGGLLEPSSGTVFQEGPPPPGCLNPLTYVFQDFALLPWRTVAGNISLVLEDHRLSTADRRDRVSNVLSKTGLSDFADALPKQLSGGMRQRVGIARALAVDPAILLMDEPLSALDAQTRTLLMEEFARLFGAVGVTGVYVTHNLTEAIRLAHRVVALSRRPGRIKKIIDVPAPLLGRDPTDPALIQLETELWHLIRDEAAAADKELEHVG